MRQIVKDPSEILDWWLCYATPTIDNRLGDDTISGVASITLDPPGEIVVVDSGINATQIIDDHGVAHPPRSAIAVWLSGGVAGACYEMTVTFVTEGGRTYDDTILIRCLND